jgi:hypothetical protein
MNDVRIDVADLAPVVETHEGLPSLQCALESAATPRALLSVLARYAQFNGAFGPGLANLAGEIGARSALFVDADEPFRLVADRAAEVASDFFSAAVDEFDDRATSWRDTHRTLAQATLKGAGRFFGFAPDQLDAAIAINDGTREGVVKVLHGYGVGERLGDERLFSAMGFHVASEVLADREFTLLDAHLRSRRPELVAALRAEMVEQAGGRHDAYYWVHIHTGVEAEHFDAAVRGVNQALRYYAGPETRAVVKQQILRGFAGFAAVQAAFMAQLGEQLPA